MPLNSLQLYTWISPPPLCYGDFSFFSLLVLFSLPPSPPPCPLLLPVLPPLQVLPLSLETPASVEVSNSWPLPSWAPRPQGPALHSSPYPWPCCVLESSGSQLWIIPRTAHAAVMPLTEAPHLRPPSAVTGNTPTPQAFGDLQLRDTSTLSPPLSLRCLHISPFPAQVPCSSFQH